MVKGNELHLAFHTQKHLNVKIRVVPSLCGAAAPNLRRHFVLVTCKLYQRISLSPQYYILPLHDLLSQFAIRILKENLLN